ncbi:MAG: aspartyl/glutamyl-tRNA(Asn/Gln) amidotransferase C subunit, partial [Myxococcota bacterium]
DMGSILEHLAALEEVDVDGVEIYVAATAGPLRPDQQETRLDQEEVFAQAPRRRDREFVVPKAIS